MEIDRENARKITFDSLIPINSVEVNDKQNGPRRRQQNQMYV